MLAHLILVVFLGSASAETAVISGRAEVLDGDTLTVGGIPVRLVGIDAPELRQTCKDQVGGEYPCGEAASGALIR